MTPASRLTGGLVLALLLLGLLALPAGARAVAGKAYRIGWLRPDDARIPLTPYLAERLHELGYVEGRNLVIEHRGAEGRLERLPALAAELVAAHVDLIVATSVSAVQAARDATRTIPIVMAFASDPVENRLVATLARPGGNVTGVSYGAGTELAGKRVELLREMVPRATRIAVLSSGEPHVQTQAAVAERTARALGVRLLVVEAREHRYDRAFARMVEERAGAVFVPGSSILNQHRRRIVDLAARHRLPAIYEWREMVVEGGLMSYGGNQRALFGRAAEFVDRILRGANPAELPVEQWSSFELAVNLTTARALGLVVPPGIQARADYLVE